MNGNLAMKKDFYTPQEFQELRERSDVQYEYEYGSLVALASPSISHQRISRRLLVALDQHLSSKNCEVLAEVDCNLNQDDTLILCPDLSVICDPNNIKSHQIFGAPDIVIEILSPSTRTRDIFKKTMYYRHAGVKEYWIVDEVGKAVTVKKFSDRKDLDGLTFLEQEGAILVSDVLPSFSLDISLIF